MKKNRLFICILAIAIAFLALSSCDHAYIMEAKFKVSFDAGTGSGSRAPELTKPNGRFTVPDNEKFIGSKAEPNFYGWKYGDNVYRPGDVITVPEDSTITAMWLPNKTISFVGGESQVGSMDSVTQVQGSVFKLPGVDRHFEAPQKPIKGRGFVGWMVKIGDKQPVFHKAGDTIILNEDAEAVALWSQIYVVRYAPGDGATGTINPNFDYVLKGQEYELRDFKGFDIQDDKAFAVWKIESGPFHSIYRSVGDTITITGNTNVTAVWKDVFKVHFDKGDPAASGARAPVSVLRDDIYSIPGDSGFMPPLPKGRHFIGWQYISATEDKLLLPGVRQKIQSDVLLRAIWSPKATIAFDANTSEGASGNMDSIEVAVGELTVPAPRVDAGHFVAPEDMAFHHWEVINAQGKVLGTTTPGALLTVKEDITLLAHWKGLWYISFDPNGGSGTMQNAKLGIDATNLCKVFRSDSYVIPPSSFVPPAYPANSSFMFWKSGNKIYKPGVKIDKVLSDMTFVAQWSPTVRISYAPMQGYVDINKGPVASQIIAKGAEVVVAENTFLPPDEHSYFKGWLYKGALVQPGTKIILQSDVVLEAAWGSLYKVSFELSDGKLIPLTEADINSAPKGQYVPSGARAKDPATMGNRPRLWRYVFKHWSAPGEKTPFDFANTPITSSIVLHAEWAKKKIDNREDLLTEIYGYAGGAIFYGHDGALRDPAYETYQELNYIDPAGIKNMHCIFSGDGTRHMDHWGANPSLVPIDVPQNPQHQFYIARTFNGRIDEWDMSQATNMEGMFSCATKFNQDISMWDVSKVEDMVETFQLARVFNQPIGRWNTASLRLLYATFHRAAKFNQDLSAWNTSKVTNMSNLFNDAPVFNGDISTWDTSQVTTMEGMFNYATSFNGSLEHQAGTGIWDVSKVENMHAIFSSMYGPFEGKGLSTWDVSSVKDLSSAFQGLSKSFKENIGNWNTESLENMYGIFSGALFFNQELNWKTSKVRSLLYAFQNCISFEGKGLSAWDIKPEADTRYAFINCPKLDRSSIPW